MTPCQGAFRRQGLSVQETQTLVQWLSDASGQWMVVNVLSGAVGCQRTFSNV